MKNFIYSKCTRHSKCLAITFVYVTKLHSFSILALLFFLCFLFLLSCRFVFYLPERITFPVTWMKSNLLSAVFLSAHWTLVWWDPKLKWHKKWFGLLFWASKINGPDSVYLLNLISTNKWPNVYSTRNLMITLAWCSCLVENKRKKIREFIQIKEIFSFILTQKMLWKWNQLKIRLIFDEFKLQAKAMHRPVEMSLVT